MQPKFVVGLDIGTTKVGVVIATSPTPGEVSIIGVGTSSHSGLRKGNIINLEETVRAIKEAVKNAELQAGVKVDEVNMGIAGEYVESSNSSGVVGITGPENEISHEDVQRVIEAARNYARPREKRILHVLPQQYMVDDQEGIAEPVRMVGVRLEAIVHIITTHESPMLNSIRAVEKAGYKVRNVVMGQLASSMVVLDKYEKELGVCLVDIGGGSADIAMFYDGSLRYSAVVPWGGQHVTSDIASGLRIPTEKAESVKINYGDVMMERNVAKSDIRIEGLSGRPDQMIPHSFLAEIIVPRLSEILELVQEKMQESDLAELMRAGVVITGGTAFLPGLRELAERIFGLPVKIGVPIGIKGLQDNVSSPVYTTAVGLAKYGIEQGSDGQQTRFGDLEDQILSWKDKIIKFFNDFF